ncbi:protein APCDD1-like [Bombus impatiens]|uniref:Protein APCDD1-like n=1 Tax=Bombus impatiens TaxID=132113 RepID=A0A6P3V6P9_BOMIM|nr:protein APCDD1-like [Bombus impatiens]
MQPLITVPFLCLFIGFDYTVSLESETEDDNCEMMMKRIDSDDKAAVTDNTPSRLHSTWISHECEIRAGPKYIIRKYNFFKNDSFLLLQYHYDEESCSIATYTVVARGSVKILSPSIAIPGATETSVQLDSVYLIPLNRQVAHKFGRIMNASCGGTETKWRPYLAQLIYERSMNFSSPTDLNMYDLNYNSLQSRLLRPKKQHTMNCLESFEIDFSELNVLRVEIKRPNIVTKSEAIGKSKMRERIELLLGGLARNARSQKTQQKPKRLQSTSLLRADTATDCPICGSVYRATEYSPPLFHQAPPLPAVIGGLWLSVRCESIDGGFWSKRFFRIYSDNSRWFARWNYYGDSACSNSLYSINAAGTYVQRAVRQRRDVKNSNVKTLNTEDLERIQKDLKLNVYRHLFQDTEELNILESKRRQKMKIQKQESTVDAFQIQKDNTLPSGTTELELRILESLLIPLSNMVSTSCEGTTKELKRIRNEAGIWSKNCMFRTGFEAPATLKFKARIGLDWRGDYTLLLASWKDDLWEAPLRQCSELPSRNHFRESRPLPLFRRGNRYNRFSRYTRNWFLSSFAMCLSTSSLLIHSTVLLLLYRLHFVY